jgi:hypothetical protein
LLARGRPVSYDRPRGTTVVRRCLLVATLTACACAGRPPHGADPGAAAPEAALASATPAADPFGAEVAPILARRCAPCHNPGGRMYDTMPFDQPATVTAHPEGILKRIKDPAEHAAIQSWLASNAPR